MHKIDKIGIIGGAGVAAGVEIASRFERMITDSGATQNQHHPEIVLYQASQAPSRSLFLEGKGPSFIPYYIEAAKKLKNFGCKFICMSCNTAHFAINDIRKSANIPIIDMIKETFEFVNKNYKNSKIGIICSDGSRHQGLFDMYVTHLKGDYKIIYPNDTYQKLVVKGINNIKAGKHRSLPIHDFEHPAAIFFSVINHLYGQGCDLIILGCTEVSLAANYLPLDKNIIDSMDILVRSSLHTYNII